MNMNLILKPNPFTICGMVTLAGLAGCNNAEPEKKLNVLFIAIDDLRPHVGCYGFDYVKTPNIDRVAQNGLIFTRAYCQQALSSPSRTSLLTGLYPDVTGIRSIGPHFRDTMPDIVTLPQYFKDNGWFTRGFGKIYHNGLDDPKSWTVPHEPGKNPRYAPEGQAILQKRREENKDNKDPNKRFFGPPFEYYECADNYFVDGGNTESALKALETLKDTTFFLAVGFTNPHIPYVTPKRYWDMYNSDDIKLPDNQFPPENAPAWAIQSLNELNSYYNVPSPLTDSFKRDLIHGYLAATSYVDAQIGLLIDALEKYNLTENTVVIIFGDHGYQLGEHAMWSSKHTNYETSALSLMVISAPGMKAKGGKTASITEFLDIYPSLADICGLEVPVQCQGKSFKKLLDNPEMIIKSEAYNLYPRGGYMGHAVRDDRYRLVKWVKKDEVVYELYDHQMDPDENKNIAADPAIKPVIEKLEKSIDDRIKADMQMNNTLTGAEK